MRIYFIIILSVVATVAAATVAIPSISFVVHEASNDDGIRIHATNITPEEKAFIRLEVNYLAPTSSSGGWVVEHFQINALCECDVECDEIEREMRPWETLDFLWDGRAEDCSPAKPGRYRVQLVAKCESEGCLGAYYIGIGDSFDLD
jgi:hypothetical protein